MLKRLHRYAIANTISNCATFEYSYNLIVEHRLSNQVKLGTLTWLVFFESNCYCRSLSKSYGMNTNLSLLVNLGAYIQDVLSMYLLPIGVLVVIIVVLVLFLIGRGKSGETASTKATPVEQWSDSDVVLATDSMLAGMPDNATVIASHIVPATDTAAASVEHRLAILVVDDSAVARAKLSKLFESVGYRVRAAKDGLEAMEFLAVDFFSVLVTDLEMPKMDGIELIAAVHGSMDTEDLPMIAITGHDELQARVHDYQGLYGIFKKPWNDRELLKRVETLSVLRKPPQFRANESGR